MGGFIAQALAARAPERVESLALLSTDPGGPGAIRAEPADWGRLVDHTGTPRERASRTISVIFPPDGASMIAPVLIGHGAEDVVIPPGNTEMLAARFPGARIELFAGAGHAFPAQRPEAVAALIATGGSG
jgi:pimeloyl-ACP methyl ester carboxylesterase